ncbi:hypothetical protein P3S38_25965 [Enterobacter hormaechei]|uniref:hypothetical protein n=1 Tax=Enterobacter hormaechei TaxID=158836 RepID=UPI0023E37A4C|nr:hypothetical protein [Enterobacter hormaechei]MDF3680442.1 hypothetical protein [Enterobacter hormaechei]
MKNGYVWRKRCQSGMISISIKTREPQEALQRATRMHLRFLELEKAQLNRAEIQGALTRFRDDMIRDRKIEALSAVLTGSVAQPTLSSVAAQITLQEAVAEQIGHLYKLGASRNINKLPQCATMDVYVSRLHLRTLLRMVFTTISLLLAGMPCDP